MHANQQYTGNGLDVPTASETAHNPGSDNNTDDTTSAPRASKIGVRTVVLLGVSLQNFKPMNASRT